MKKGIILVLLLVAGSTSLIYAQQNKAQEYKSAKVEQLSSNDDKQTSDKYYFFSADKAPQLASTGNNKSMSTRHAVINQSEAIDKADLSTKSHINQSIKASKK